MRFCSWSTKLKIEATIVKRPFFFSGKSRRGHQFVDILVYRDPTPLDQLWSNNVTHGERLDLCTCLNVYAYMHVQIMRMTRDIGT